MRINDAILGAVLLAFSLVVGLYADLSSHTGSGVRGIGVPDLDFHSARALLDHPDSGRHAAMGGNRRRVAGPWARSGHHLRALAITIALVVFYILASTPLRFIPTAFIENLPSCSPCWVSARCCARPGGGGYHGDALRLLQPAAGSPRGAC